MQLLTLTMFEVQFHNSTAQHSTAQRCWQPRNQRLHKIFWSKSR